MVATSVPGFLSPPGAISLRITASGWAEFSANGSRSECRLGGSELAELADALARLPAQHEIVVVDDVSRRTLKFRRGGRSCQVVLFGPPWDDGYAGRVAAEAIWTRIHQLVRGESDVASAQILGFDADLAADGRQSGASIGRAGVNSTSPVFSSQRRTASIAAAPSA